jgi:hypothetical protein
MKELCLILSLVLTAVSAAAQNSTIVHWRQITGVITAPGVDNPVAGVIDPNGTATNLIHSGAGPWTTKGGSAHINLVTGEGAFDVEGLVLNGGNATGTPGQVKSVVGTVVCNAGAQSQAIIDTPAVDLELNGNASLSFKISVPSTCSTPLFLIRVPQAGLRWIATGAVPVVSSATSY